MKATTISYRNRSMVSGHFPVPERIPGTLITDEQHLYMLKEMLALLCNQAKFRSVRESLQPSRAACLSQPHFFFTSLGFREANQ